MNNILNIFKPSASSSTTIVQSLAIVPDRPSLTYNIGELVTGHCILSVNGSLDISQVEIKLSGKATVKIPATTQQTTTTVNHTTVPSNVHQVIHKQVPILNLIYNPASVYQSTLTTGRHDIGYSFMIPQNVPGSMEHQFGDIRYKLKVRISGHDVKNAELHLHILSNPAVPMQELYAPIVLQNEKTVGLISGKRVVLKCEIPRTGFTLGSPIPINCYINNTSKKYMVLRGSLKQEMTFKADTVHTRTVTNKLTTADGPQIEPRIEANHQLILQVPINLPIVHNTCPLISIKYIASVKLDIPGAIDLHCKMPVLLTNQPMQSLQSQQPHGMMMPGQSPPMMPGGHVMPPQPPPGSMVSGYPQLPQQPPPPMMPGGHVMPPQLPPTQQPPVEPYYPTKA